MIVDALLALSGSISGNTVSGQTATGTGVTVVSTNNVDVSSQGVPSGQVRDLGEGVPLYGRFEVVTAASGGTSVEMRICASDDAAGTVNVTTIGTTGPIAVANLTAGARFVARVNPVLASKGQRYITAQYVTVGAVAAGAYYADIGDGIQDGQKFYPSGYAVL